MESVPLIPEPLWRPHPDQIRDSNLAKFREWLRENRSLDLRDHHALYDWSVGDLEGFWSAIAEFFDVRFHTSPERVLQLDADPIRTKWFPGGRIVFPRAAVLGQLALHRNNFVPGEKLEPIYLRETTFVKAPPPRIVPPS